MIVDAHGRRLRRSMVFLSSLERAKPEVTGKTADAIASKTVAVRRFNRARGVKVEPAK